MNAVVAYESVYGNTRAIAEAIAEGLGAEAVPVQEVRGTDVDLLVVGAPTHLHGLPTTRSRRVAVEAAREDGHVRVELHAGDETGLRGWLRDLPEVEGRLAAAFDTRLDRSPVLTGVAARGIARRLRRRGYEVAAIASFLVEESEGPLEDGEIERARAWGVELAGLASRAAERV